MMMSWVHVMGVSGPCHGRLRSMSWVSWSYRDLIVVDRHENDYEPYLNSQHASWWCHGFMSWASHVHVMGIMISSWPHRGRSTWEWSWTKKKKMKSFFAFTWILNMLHDDVMGPCHGRLGSMSMGVSGPCHGYHDLIVTSSWSIDMRMIMNQKKKDEKFFRIYLNSQHGRLGSMLWASQVHIMGIMISSWPHCDLIVVNRHENDHEPKKKDEKFFAFTWILNMLHDDVMGPCHGYHDLIVTSSWSIDMRMIMNKKKDEKFFAFTWILNMLHDDVMGSCHGYHDLIVTSSWPHRDRSTWEWPWTKKKDEKFFRIYLNSQHASWWCHGSMSWVSWSHRDLIVVDRHENDHEPKKKDEKFFMLHDDVMGASGPCHGRLRSMSSWVSWSHRDLIVVDRHENEPKKKMKSFSHYLNSQHASWWCHGSMSWVSWSHRDLIVINRHENDHEPKKKMKSFSALPEFSTCFMMMSWVHVMGIMISSWPHRDQSTWEWPWTKKKRWKVFRITWILNMLHDDVMGPCHGRHRGWEWSWTKKKDEKFFAFTWILNMLHDDVMGPCHGYHDLIVTSSWSIDMRMNQKKKDEKFFAFTWILNMLHDDVMGIMISSWPHHDRSTWEWPWTKKKDEKFFVFTWILNMLHDDVMGPCHGRLRSMSWVSWSHRDLIVVDRLRVMGIMISSWPHRGRSTPCHGYHDLIVIWPHRDLIVIDRHENDHEPKKKMKSFSHLPEFSTCFMMMSWVHVMGVSCPCHGYHDLIVI